MALQAHQGPIAGTSWNPSQYLKFADHRLRPALELLNRVPLASPATIYDLGCGPGGITRLLAEQWPAATIYGLDNSPEMLQEAAGGTQPHPVDRRGYRHLGTSRTARSDLLECDAALGARS